MHKEMPRLPSKKTEIVIRSLLGLLFVGLFVTTVKKAMEGSSFLVWYPPFALWGPILFWGAAWGDIRDPNPKRLFPRLFKFCNSIFGDLGFRLFLVGVMWSGLLLFALKTTHVI